MTALVALLLLPLARAELPAAATAALRRGDCPTASAALRGLDTLEAAMAQASCGDPSRQEGRLGQGGPLEPYARLLLARGAIDADPRRAEALLSGLSLPGEAGLELRLIRARAQIAQGRGAEAREDLRGMLSGPQAAEALYWLARAAEARGDTPAATDAYRSLWGKHVSSPRSEEAARRLGELGAPVPDTTTAAGRELALARARALVKASRPAEALPLLHAALPPAGARSAAQTHELAQATFQARDYPAALALLAQLQPTESGAYGGADTLFDYALCTSRAGDYATAAERYARLVALYPGSAQADTASFKIAYLRFDAGDLAAAIPLFQEHLARFPSSKHKDEALWFMGWSSYRLGDLDGADRHLARLAAEHPGSSLTPGAAYWGARILGRRGDAGGERAALERVLSRYPESGHAWFAAERLGRSFPGLGAFTVPALPAAFLDAHPEVRSALALGAAGQWAWARELLLGVRAAAAAADRTTTLAFAHALLDAGAFQQAQALARPHCGSARSGDPVALSACTPRPEPAVVEQAAARAGLYPLLPYAIMTAESALDPSVTSIAGARGLMQLMPELGRELHAELLPGAPYDPDRLYAAGYNAWLGTTELGRLHQRFGGAGVNPSLPLVIAGYNGGAEAVSRWLGEYPSPPEGDWFAENVSYTETRRYVRTVLGYVMRYRWIYGDPAPSSRGSPLTTPVPLAD